MENDLELVASFEAMGMVGREETTPITDNEEAEDIEQSIHPTTEQVDPQETSNESDDEDYIQTYAKELGYEGEVTGEGLEALISIAQARISSVEEKYAAYDNAQVQAFAKHLQEGGTPNTFLGGVDSEPTNYFRSVETIEEDDIDSQEGIIRANLEQKGQKAKIIEATIRVLKEDGELYNTSIEALDEFKQLEQEEEDNYNLNRQAIIEQERKEHAEYVQGVQGALNAGMKDTILDKSIQDQLSKYVLPDNKGELKINEVVSQLSPEQHLRVQAFIMSIAQDKPFNYKPISKEVRTSKIPFSKLLKSGSNSSQSLGSLSDLEKQMSNN